MGPIVVAVGKSPLFVNKNMEDGLMAAFLFQSKIRTDNSCPGDTIESLIQVFRLAASASDLI